MLTYRYPLYQVPPCASFAEFLETIYLRYRNRTAFEEEQTQWSYEELYDSVRKIIAQFGSKRGCYFCLTAEHPFLFCVAYLALVITGNIVVLTSGVERTKHKDYPEINDSMVLHCLGETLMGDIPFFSEPDAICTVAQSSGTTSVAKGVMLSQKNLLSDMCAGMNCYEYPDGARYYHILPYYHLFGLVADMLAPLYSGGTICFSQNSYAFFRNLRQFHPDNLNLPPAMADILAQLLEKSEGKDITGGNLSKIMCAGSALTENTQSILIRYGIQALSAYGLTECSPCVSMSRDMDWKLGSAGVIIPCCEVRIVDGEITVHGENVMLGYWNDPDATRKVIRNGWLYTGDLGYLDEDGFLFLTGRKSNLIVFEDGTKLFPEMVEAEISCVPGIRECVILERKRNRRTMVELILCMDSSSSMMEPTHRARVLLEKHCLPGNILSVTLSKQPLARNRLGKLDRKRYSDGNID